MLNISDKSEIKNLKSAIEAFAHALLILVHKLPSTHGWN